ncbi:MAG TPA: 6-bladed beta-propeller [Dehalococcoidales bacterium]
MKNYFFLLLVCIVLTAGSLSVAPVQAVDLPEFPFEWDLPYGSGPWGESVYPIAIDSSDNVYVGVIGGYGHEIQKFDCSGTLLTCWTQGVGTEWWNVTGIAVDSSDNVNVLDYFHYGIFKYTSNGTLLSNSLGHPQTISPTGIAMDSSDNIYVITQTLYDWKRWVKKFDTNGLFLTRWGLYGTDEPTEWQPSSIAVDSSNYIYVTDEYNQCVHKFSSNGTPITDWGSAGAGDGQFNGPHGITVDKLGNVYVCDSGNNRIQKFDSNGNFLTKWGSAGSDDGQFNLPYGIAVNSLGHIYVADRGNHRIQVFDEATAKMPELTSISPNTATAGGDEFTIAAYGWGFTNNSIIKWFGSSGEGELPTTYISPTQLSATVPVSLFNSPMTVEIFVQYPDGSMSIWLPLFITETSTTITEWDAGTSTDQDGNATASIGGEGPSTPGSLTATGSGSGTVVVAQYESNPGGTPSFMSTNSYFDVYLDINNNFAYATIIACNLNGGNVVYWWNGAEWIVVSDQVYDAVSGSITITVTDSTTPSLCNLQGSIFGVGIVSLDVEEIIPSTLMPCPIGSTISVNSSFSALVMDSPYMVNIYWGDQIPPTSVLMNTQGYVSAEHTYLSPGVYTIRIVVTDGCGRMGEASYQYIVIYNPDGGFVTGGGWIDSPAGAYSANQTLTGKASFGFVSKYQKGANVPTGQTEFQFKVGNLHFKSTIYDWLVVSGARAQFKGSGTINGTGDYSFILTARDGQINGGGGIDSLRIKIWDKVTGNIIYDNKMGVSDTSSDLTELSGGSIVIHK